MSEMYFLKEYVKVLLELTLKEKCGYILNLGSDIKAR